MGKFDGKTVLITGGARGQGRSHADTFAAEGADIAICDIAAPMSTVPYELGTVDDLAETVRIVESYGRKCVSAVVDVRDARQVDEFVDQVREQFGRIDIALANAGIFTFSPVAEMSDATWNETIDTNLTGTFNTLRAVARVMQQQGGMGRIVATASMAGKAGYETCGHYCASKWAVIGLVKSLALELASTEITVNAVCPTTVDTPMIHSDAAYKLFVPDAQNPTRDDVIPAFASINPMPVPWIDVKDVSAAIAFLCSPEARYITGDTIALGAGMNARNAG